MTTRNTRGQAPCLFHSFPNCPLNQRSIESETGWKPVVLCLAFFFIFLHSSICLRAFGQEYSIDWYKVSSGGGTSTGGVYSVSGTIGQPDASGAISGGNYSLTGGFWALYAVQTPGAPLLTI